MKPPLALLLAFQIALGYSQPIHSDQIQEDMEVVSAALLTLLENEREERNLEDLPVDVQFRYMAGSGVVFSAPLGPQISMPQVLGVKDRSFIDVSSKEEHPENGDQRAKYYVEASKAAIWSFLTNYGSLLRNLGPSEVVVMKTFWMKHHPQLIKKDDPNRVVAGIEMSVEVADLLDHDAGNIDEAALLEKVKIKELPEENRSADIEVFGGILRKLMSENLSETYL